MHPYPFVKHPFLNEEHYASVVNVVLSEQVRSLHGVVLVAEESFQHLIAYPPHDNYVPFN